MNSWESAYGEICRQVSCALICGSTCGYEMLHETRKLHNGSHTLSEPVTHLNQWSSHCITGWASDSIEVVVGIALLEDDMNEISSF